MYNNIALGSNGWAYLNLCQGVTLDSKLRSNEDSSSIEVNIISGSCHISHKPN